MNESIHFEGLVEITRIENSGEKSSEIGTLTARFVRYPGSQQLQVWLPESGYNGYGQIRLIDCSSDVIIEEYPIQQKLSGSVQLLWNTLCWSPGQYRIEIDNPGKGLHCLYFTKREVDSFIPANGIVEMPIARAGSPSMITDLLPKHVEKDDGPNDSLWKIYRDGFGNPIPNLDLDIREQAFERLRESFKLATNEEERLEFENYGKGGYISYIQQNIIVRFWYEPGTDGCVMFVEIPGKDQWEKQTKLPLTKRREVLLFVASGVKRQFVVNWRFQIDDCSIQFYR